MIYQKTDGIHPDLAEWGCYFLDVTRLYELKSGLSLSVSDVNNVYTLCRNVGLVGEEVTMIKGAVAGVLHITSGQMGKKVYGKRVKKDDKWMYRIARFRRVTERNKVVEHFVIVALNDNVTFDSYSQYGSKTARIGRIIDYRYIFIED
jgi:hypothetical protein